MCGYAAGFMHDEAVGVLGHWPCVRASYVGPSGMRDATASVMGSVASTLLLKKPFGRPAD